VYRNRFAQIFRKQTLDSSKAIFRYLIICCIVSMFLTLTPTIRFGLNIPISTRLYWPSLFYTADGARDEPDSNTLLQLNIANTGILGELRRPRLSWIQSETVVRIWCLHSDPH